MKRIVIDLDNTLTSGAGAQYEDAPVNGPLVEKLREYKAAGFEIAIHTSRNMRTYNNNTGKIAANTLPVIVDWLKRHDVPYDEIWIGKPWCGEDGFYVDDRAVRPSEFESLSYQQIRRLLQMTTQDG